MRRHLIPIAAIWGALAIGFGAFGAHALQAHLDERGQALWRTGNLYHLFAAPALLAFAALEPRVRSAGPGLWLVLGSAVFSGTLYAMALGGPRWLGAVTPVGGSLMIVAWILLAVRAFRSSSG